MTKDMTEPLSPDQGEAKKGPNEDEIFRLAGRGPLKTIVLLMIGPILSQIVGALFGVIGTLWISKTVGEEGMAAVGTEFCFEGMGRSFGYFLMVAASTQISALFGKHLEHEATQIVCDLLRVSLICGAVVPALLLPFHDKAATWFGASPTTVRMGWDYLLPLIGGTFATCINLTLEGVLQAEGRTLLLGFLNLVSLVVAMGVFAPIFMLVMKLGVAGIGWSVVLADGVQGLGLSIFYFWGKFGVKPKFNELLKPFSKHTWQALTVGASQLISNLANCVPGIPMRKLIGYSSGLDMYDVTMAGFNVICRYEQVINCVLIAVTTGYIPPGSYAYAAGLFGRWIKLSLHAAWIATVWSVATGVLSWAIPRQISMLFRNDETFLHYATGMMRYGNALGVVAFVRFNTQAMLQTMQSGVRAMIVSFFSNFVATIGFAYVLYYTNKHDVVRLMWVYPLSIATGVVLGIALIIGPLIKTYKIAKSERVKLPVEEEEEDSKMEPLTKLDAKAEDETRSISEL